MCNDRTFCSNHLSIRNRSIQEYELCWGQVCVVSFCGVAASHKSHCTSHGHVEKSSTKGWFFWRWR